MDEPGAEAEIGAVNAAFYDAFEARDLDRMSDVWEHSDRVTCTHPGWRTLHGWGRVSASWVALFDGRQRLQFILTDAETQLAGDAGWVTVTENLIDDGGATSAVAAINLFVHRDGGWKMVAHHASAVGRVSAP